MMKTLGRAMVLLCVGAALAGCSNTADGVQKDATNDAAKADQAATTAAVATDKAVKKVGDSVKDVPKDVKSAVDVTPKVKAAILQDPVLRNDKNLINVDSHDNVTHLRGHVLTNDMKTRAGQDAQTALSGDNSDFKVSNELTVSGG